MKFLTLAWAAVAAAATVSPHLDSRSKIPSKFSWTSTQPLIYPKKDSHNLKAIKDPSVVFYNGKYHVFASQAAGSGYNLVYVSFSDWSKAEDATFHYLDQTAIGKGYRAAPQAFYHPSKKTWFLVYQSNLGASYSTNTDLSNPDGWTAPKSFYPSGNPSVAHKGNWVDMWVICDSSKCHMFSSGDNGMLYRAETSLSSFPSGFGQPVVALQESNMWDLYEASMVYNIGGTYLLAVECAGRHDGYRYFRSWTSNSLSGKWTPLAATEENPFAGSYNVKFGNKTWTKYISHGEVVRKNVDYTMTIDACNMQFLYQGVDPNNRDQYDAMPYKLGLLTQTGGC